MDKQIERIMQGLNCDEATAIEIANADKEIEHNVPMSFDLTPEQQKEAKKYTNVKEHKKKNPTVYEFTKRERKVNTTKKSIVEYLAQCFKDYDNVAIVNAERQIKFSADGNDYELTLVQKRKPKN